MYGEHGEQTLKVCLLRNAIVADLAQMPQFSWPFFLIEAQCSIFILC